MSDKLFKLMNEYKEMSNDSVEHYEELAAWTGNAGRASDCYINIKNSSSSNSTEYMSHSGFLIFSTFPIENLSSQEQSSHRIFGKPKKKKI